MRTLFDHENLRVYQAAIGFVAWLQEVTPAITSKVSACDHLARASSSVPVNIAEASGKRSMNERSQFIDTAYGSSLECAACLDILGILDCVSATTVHEGKNRLSMLVCMLVGFRKSAAKEVREEGVTYVVAVKDHVWFDHENLDVYAKALAFVAWCGRLWCDDSVPRIIANALDKASTAVALNIAEGNGKFSFKDRCRFVGHARTAALQAAATLDVLAVRAKSPQDVIRGKCLLSDAVRMLVAWEGSLGK